MSIVSCLTAGIQFGQQKELCEIKLNGQVINWRTIKCQASW